MSVAWKLALAYAMRHPLRLMLTSLAMIASACLVVWVVSSFDALASQTRGQAAEYLGRYDLFVVPEDPAEASVSTALVEQLRQDPAVAEVTPVVQLETRLLNPNAGPGGPGGPGGSVRPVRPVGQVGRVGPLDAPGSPGGFGGSPLLVGTDAREPPRALVAGTWIDPQHPERRGAVIGKGTAERMGFQLGDEALVIFGTKEFRLQIAGLIEEETPPLGLSRGSGPHGTQKARTGIEAGPAWTAIYVPLSLATHFTRGQAKVNLINIRLKPEAKPQLARFRATWEVRIARIRPAASVLGADDIKRGIEEGLLATRTRQEAWAATGLSLLAALFIIFSTLSIGVTERIRQFGILRAVGLSRTQVALVIALEGVLLALIGWGGGLLAGWGLIAIAARSQSGLFAAGATLGPWCVALTGLSALGGSLAASVLPAWRAMRVQPLEAMSPSRAVRSGPGWTTALGIAGLALIAVNPILVYVASATMSSDTLYAVYAAVGCTTMAVGFLLLTPATILIGERLLGPVLARLLLIEPRLLRSQLGSNLWRTLGTTAALTVGLGLFVSLQIWGYSMLEPFKPGAWVPDALVSFQPGGLPDSEIAAVRAIPGVRAGQCLPLAVEQPKLASDITGSEDHASVIRQDNVVMVGLDPRIAFGGSDPLVKAQFVAGRPDEAIAKLQAGRNCLVPDHFLRAANLKLGDQFSLVPPHSPTTHVEYTIVGAVSLPGWHWMSKVSGLRRREGRSAAMVFADFAVVRRDFELPEVNFFWLNVDQAGDAKPAAVAKIGEALQPIAERNMAAAQPFPAPGPGPFGASKVGQSVRISTPDEVGARLLARASGVIWASCYLALITLVVTSLGVINTVMASVRARRWEFGVLRSQGVTRSGLVRMVLAEGLLIGLITCLLSLAFGVFSAWCGTGISQSVSFFGGLAPPLVIPWPSLAFGFALTLALCLAAALGPAVATGRAEPLRLLQEGRAAL